MVELTWDGKYDANGRRVAPLRLKLPFQTVETVNESAQQRQMALDLFGRGRPAEWRNRLIWGDKKYVLPALLDEFAGRIDLIYIDPPFNVGADFSYQARIEDEEFTKAPTMIEQKAYRDTWGRGLDSYLQWFYETIVLLRDLLNEGGSLFVHLDWHIGQYAKVALDEIFTASSFVNEVIWHYKRWPTPTPTFQKMHDNLYWYEKTEGKHTFNRLYGERTESTQRRWKDKKITAYHDEEGRRIPSGSAEEGSSGASLDDVWEIPIVAPVAHERTGYATQKPETLLERIVTACSNENDLVLDCFCGSGTTAAVAEKLNRRWIACDLGRFAIHTTRKRLLSVENVRPFVVQNLGKYERQAWQAAEFGDPQKAAAVVHNYRRFILELYHTRPIEGYTWLHGVKGGRMVHVGAVDSPISPSDVTQIAIEFRKAVGTGKDAPGVAAVDVLGWDFAFELNEVAKQQAAQANITLRFLRIPREVLEQKAVEQGDIKFFELAALAVDVAQKGRGVTLKLTDFVIPPDDVPADVQRAISHWSQWIDYWAVDWDNQGDTFHNMWQTYRTRQDKTLQLQVAHAYERPGEYTIMIKVIDILGNDTTKTLKVVIL
ncbi:MAG: site-specific DNA-methyltransferase [Chloroflexota bacterium]